MDAPPPQEDTGPFLHAARVLKQSGVSVPAVLAADSSQGFLLLEDFGCLLEGAAPEDGRYRHDDPMARVVNLTDAERVNGHAHCRALLLPTSVGLNVVHGRLVLGHWQRVFFVELEHDHTLADVHLRRGEARAVELVHALEQVVAELLEGGALDALLRDGSCDLTKHRMAHVGDFENGHGEGLQPAGLQTT